MFLGVRVVRGPDWKWGDQDGGPGSVGTVVQAQTKEGSGVWVRWDSGKAANYRAGGKTWKYDLRIYDTAQLGVKHPNVTCDTCGKDPIVGIRWKCQDCHNFDLCHPCYNEGKHDLGHQFSRIEGTSVPGTEVPYRFGAIKCRSIGIFPGSRVVRGPDWKWANQDGGDGTVGAVCDVGDGEGTYRSWVTVQWPNATQNSYRRGHQGQMDVRYTEKETEGEFYIEHLPNLDVCKLRGYVSSGDRVRLLDIDNAKLKELQLERCGWNEEIINLKGKVGDVIMVDKDGDVKVSFGESSFFIHPMCLAMDKKMDATEKVTTNDIEDDLVMGLLSAILKSELEALVDPGGSADGGDLFNAAINGKTSRVREIIKANPQAVKFHNEKGQTALAGAAHRGHMDSVKALVAGKAPLDVTDEDGDTALAFAVIGNKPDIAKYLLQSGSSINATNKLGLTPLHLAAAQGHVVCAEVLLNCERHCNVNAKDKNGNTPLFIAMTKDEKQITRLLVEHNDTNLRITNDNGFNALHHAVFSNSFAVQRILSKAPSMINIAKDDGFTALHLAALNGLADILLILIKQGNCDKEQRNGNGQTALHLAVDKSHNKCIEALVNNGANVNAQDNDGDTCLHIVMMNANLQELLGALPVVQLLQLAQQLTTEGKTDPKENLIAIAVYLVKNNANIYMKNKKGSDVLDVTHNPRVKSLLKQLYDRKREAAGTSSSKCKVQ